MSLKCHQRFLAFEKRTCHREQHASSSNFKRRCERLHDNTRRSLPRRPACSSPLPTMLDIGSVFAHFVEDRISWTRVTARNADLYDKRPRHWSTMVPIPIFVWFTLAWLALSISGVHWRDEWRYETPFQNQERFICNVISTVITMLRAFQLCRMLRRASPSTAMLVVIALCHFPTARVLAIAKYNLIHCQVSWVNHCLYKQAWQVVACSTRICYDQFILQLNRFDYGKPLQSPPSKLVSYQ